MAADGKLRAWIESSGDAVLAAFVGVPAAGQVSGARPPATKLCASSDDARKWIEHEAGAFGLPVEWVGGARGRAA
jgi:hypothetical protein